MTPVPPITILVLLASILTAAAALVVFRARPQHPQNRNLAALLLILAVADAADSGLRPLANTANGAFALVIAARSVLWFTPAVLARFYATLPGSFGRAVAWLPVRWALDVACAAAAAVMVAKPGAYIQSMGWDSTTHTFLIARPGPLYPTLLVTLTTAFAAGIPACLAALRHARAALERRKLAWLAAAFVLFNAAKAAEFLFYLSPAATSAAGHQLGFVAQAIESVGLCVMLAIGIVRAEVLDIRTAARRGVGRAALTGAMLVAITTVEEVVKHAVNEHLGLLAGALTVAVLLLAFHKLQSGAHALADTLVRPRATPGLGRAHAIYQAAVESEAALPPRLRRGEQALRELRLHLGLGDEPADRVGSGPATASKRHRAGGRSSPRTQRGDVTP